MGQYYYVANIDKKQFLHPHKFGDGLKLMEFGASGSGTMCGLALLLSDGNGRGGGDLDSGDSIIGSWAGDRIVIAGDYADGGRFLDGVEPADLKQIADEVFSVGYRDPAKVNLHHFATERYEDISFKVLSAMCDDEYLREDLRKSFENQWHRSKLPPDLLRKMFPESEEVIEEELEEQED